MSRPKRPKEVPRLCRQLTSDNKRVIVKYIEVLPVMPQATLVVSKKNGQR